MVAKIVSGKTIRGVLNYNEEKVAAGKAELIAGSKFMEDVAQLTYAQKFDRFKRLIQQNERTKTNAVHISLNFDKADKLGKLQLEQIAASYMEKIGFGDQPYLVYQHHDAAHKHIHIVTTNIEEGGNRISLHDIGKNQSEQARKEVEIEFGIVKAESKKISNDEYLKPISLEKAIYGQSETKAAISNTVREVVKSYKYTSLAELNAALRQFNIVADPGEPGTIKHDKKGLTYSILDKDGNKIGVPIKASKIYGRPILANLEKRFANNKAIREDFKNRLQHVLDKTLNNHHIQTRQDFAAALQEQKVQVVWRINAESRLYGVTYVDNATKTVFNGSDLGKPYSANAISERLTNNATAGDDQSLTIRQRDAILPTGPNGESIINTLLGSDDINENMDYHLKMTRKKKKRKGFNL
ncbi:relaxase/mobilization nuclease-like protein [Mucilaginibacter gracilis]|uniref:Relaxase/mobilization nuclease-like protein n=1 Tax=Mucilaginibacter gracilis TaxID=423350 RepID=A0A495IXX2_9SPHI|nr:relaxase/mobilization nuclease domain-containing protein [Mucilaginibacter gracilis]RKR80719.1 relaxase/mobilization nuclease-like protein [Mucilaginibacter gracilis]